MLRTRASSAFTRGATHPVCQDYAVHNSMPSGEFAGIFDGCSSSPDTDVGARLMARDVIQCLQRGDHELREAGRLAAHVCRSLNLPTRCLDTTIGVVFPRPIQDEPGHLQIVANLIGDGVVAVCYCHGDDVTRIFNYTIDSGAPDYKSYDLTEGRWVNYIAEFGDPLYTEDTTTLDRSGQVLFGTTRTLSRVAKERFMLDPFHLEAGGIVFVFSDGVSAVTRLEVNEEGTSRSRVPVPAETVVSEFTRVKVRKGNNWMQARMNGFVRECEARGWALGDDIAVAAVYVEEGVDDDSESEAVT